MVIEINKDIDRYKESVAMGLTAKQLAFSVASVAVGGTMVFLLYPYIGLTGAAYVAIPCVAPIALGGFYSFNGMGFYEYMWRKFYFLLNNKALTYVSTEGDLAIEEYRQETASVGKHGKQEKNFDAATEPKASEFEKAKRKMKLVLIAIIALVAIAVIGAVVLKMYGLEGGCINEHICRWLQALKKGE